jgi:hypothetical protein
VELAARDAPFIVDRTADAAAPEEARSARCFVSVAGAAGGPRTQTSHIPKLPTHDASIAADHDRDSVPHCPQH